MRIAFLGTGRMGTELALHLLPDHELTVWNRTASRTQRLAEAGAAVAGTAVEAVAGAELVVTSLFGPDAVRETVIVPSLIPDGVTWVDTTTVSPADADRVRVQVVATAPGSADELIDALATVDLPTGFAWVAGESGMVTAVRRQLLARGQEPDRVQFTGYWRLGGPL